MVSGDDLLNRLADLQSAGCDFRNLETGAAACQFCVHRSFPPTPISVRCRLPKRSTKGGRIVITGRVADASLTVGPAMHEFSSPWDDWNFLAGASVAGHLIECGAQVTGGLYRDWQDLDLANVGYPIAEIELRWIVRHYEARRNGRHRQSSRPLSSSWFTKSAIRPII